MLLPGGGGQPTSASPRGILGASGSAGPGWSHARPVVQFELPALGSGPGMLGRGRSERGPGLGFKHTTQRLWKSSRKVGVILFLPSRKTVSFLHLFHIHLLSGQDVPRTIQGTRGYKDYHVMEPGLRRGLNLVAERQGNPTEHTPIMV